MKIRQPEVGKFEHLLSAVHVNVEKLVRLSNYPKTEIWWSKGRYRFDGGNFGTCYASDDISVAFAESVIHECSWWNDGKYIIAAADINKRHIISLDHPKKRQLLLADLTGASLKKLGLSNDISAGGDYSSTQAWASAIHDASADWDGIKYISRQNNTGTAVAIFERSGVIVKETTPLDGLMLEKLCSEFSVEIL